MRHVPSPQHVGSLGDITNYNTSARIVSQRVASSQPNPQMEPRRQTDAAPRGNIHKRYLMTLFNLAKKVFEKD